MNRIALAVLLGLSAFAVQAQSNLPSSVAGEPVATPAVAETAPAAAETTVITAENVEPRTVNDTGCVRETGTKLKRRDKNGCTGAPGESYSRAEIDRSGATDTADAVRKLSTRGTVNRGH